VDRCRPPADERIGGDPGKPPTGSKKSPTVGGLYLRDPIAPKSVTTPTTRIGRLGYERKKRADGRRMQLSESAARCKATFIEQLASSVSGPVNAIGGIQKGR